MSFSEDILKLRKRVSDAVIKGVVNEDGKDFFEATLIQIMNDAEKNRQNCVTQAENLRRQAAVMDGQSGAFASVSSIIYNVINGFVSLAEREEEEEKAKIEKEELENTNITTELDLSQVKNELTGAKKKVSKKTK